MVKLPPWYDKLVGKTPRFTTRNDLPISRYQRIRFTQEQLRSQAREMMDVKHNIILWKWPHHNPNNRACQYGPEQVNTMVAMLRRNMGRIRDYRIILITDDPKGIDPSIDWHPIWPDLSDKPNISGLHLPSCYRRLKLFSPMVQKGMGIQLGERIHSIDLDAVVIRPIDHLLMRGERFVGWAVRGSNHPTVFNGSMWSFTAGDLEEVWTEFDPASSPQEANRCGYMGSDQAWLSYKLVRKDFIGGYGLPDVMSYPRELFRRRGLPAGLCIAFFHGKKKPWMPHVQAEADWITEHWRI